MLGIAAVRYVVCEKMGLEWSVEVENSAKRSTAYQQNSSLINGLHKIILLSQQSILRTRVNF